MPTVKEYNVKLARLRSTRKMTKTMKMVSANKLRKAQEARRNVDLYQHQLDAIIAHVTAGVDADAHAFLRKRGPVRRALVLLFTSDKGLCGGFNNNVNKSVLRWMSAEGSTLERLEMSFCGRRGFQFFQSRTNVRQHYEGVTHRPRYADACRIGHEIQGAFLHGRFDAVYLAYNVAVSALTQRPVIERLLPIAHDSLPSPAAGIAEDWILEPGRDALLQTLLPRLVNRHIYVALLHNAIGEHGARMTAMDNATNNAASLIDSITLLRNRARQSAITTELTEIVGGAEALK